MKRTRAKWRSQEGFYNTSRSLEAEFTLRNLRIVLSCTSSTLISQFVITRASYYSSNRLDCPQTCYLPYPRCNSEAVADRDVSSPVIGAAGELEIFQNEYTTYIKIRVSNTLSTSESHPHPASMSLFKMCVCPVQKPGK